MNHGNPLAEKARMKFFSVILLILIQHASSYAQHADKLMISDEGRIELYPEAGYISKFSGDKFPFNKTFHITITDQRSGKTKEEFFHYSDSSFSYIQYDSNQNQIATGLVCINQNRKHKDTLLIPDKDKDAQVVIYKNFIIPYLYFDKIGAWEETESPLIIRRGKYESGKKIGIWEVGHYQKNEYYPHHSPYPYIIFKVECTEKYVDGHLDSTYQPDYSFSKIWDKLKGAWSLSTLESLRGIQHKYIKPSSPDESSLIFIDSLFFKEGTSHDDKNIRWELSNGAIYKYYSKDDIRKYKIDYISDFELYLTPLPSDIKSNTNKKKK